MLSLLQSAVLKAWGVVIWCFTQVARVIALMASLLLFPRPRTHQPHPLAATAWTAIDAWLLARCAFAPPARAQLATAGALAILHFLLIVTALLVITEENDVWTGYVRCDRVGGRDDRVLNRGKAIKSLPFILVCGIFYMAYSAVALRAWHAENDIFSRPFGDQTPIADYLATVAAQIPTLETLLKWVGFDQMVMEFRGTPGSAVRYALELGNVSIVVGTVSSWFRQRREVRRLVAALGAGTGNIPALQAQAARAPEEIKSAILDMALHDADPQVRWRAMTVAEPANILTFPTTLIYNLHREPRENNKLHALAVALAILRRNRAELQPDYFAALADKIAFQLGQKRRRHGEKTLGMLCELRGLAQQDRS
jgi:hypothetical protein